MIQSIISFIAVWIVVLPFVMGIILWSKLDRDSRFIMIAVIYGLVSQLIHFYKPGSTAETIAYNLYTPLEFICYWNLFYPKLVRKAVKGIFWISLIMTSVFAFYWMQTYSLQSVFFSDWVSVNNLIYLVWIGLYLAEDFRYDIGLMSSNQPFFWYAIGIILYGSCTCVVYLFWEKASAAPGSMFSYIRTIQNIFNFITYIIYTFGIASNADYFKKLSADKYGRFGAPFTSE